MVVYRFSNLQEAKILLQNNGFSVEHVGGDTYSVKLADMSKNYPRRRWKENRPFEPTLVDDEEGIPVSVASIIVLTDRAVLLSCNDDYPFIRKCHEKMSEMLNAYKRKREA